MGRYPGGLLDRVVGICVALLVAALALNWAVHLVQEIWVPLVVIALVVVATSVGWWLWRARSRGW